MTYQTRHLPDSPAKVPQREYSTWKKIPIIRTRVECPMYTEILLVHERDTNVQGTAAAMEFTVVPILYFPRAWPSLDSNECMAGTSTIQVEIVGTREP
jgi:hypothetical protein